MLDEYLDRATNFLWHCLRMVGYGNVLLGYLAAGVLVLLAGFSGWEAMLLVWLTGGIFAIFARLIWPPNE